jgi:hypothetical protein
VLWVILILEVFISENYEKPLAMKVSNFFLQVERQVYLIQGRNNIYTLHHKCCLAWWIGLGLTLLGGLISSNDHVIDVIYFIASLIIYSVMGISHWMPHSSPDSIPETINIFLSSYSLNTTYIRRFVQFLGKVLFKTQIGIHSKKMGERLRKRR